MRWQDVLPADIAVMQTAWERRQQILRVYKKGMNAREIAEWMGVSTSRISSIVIRAWRERELLSPVEQFLTKKITTRETSHLQQMFDIKSTPD